MAKLFHPDIQTSAASNSSSKKDADLRTARYCSATTQIKRSWDCLVCEGDKAKWRHLGTLLGAPLRINFQVLQGRELGEAASHRHWAEKPISHFTIPSKQGESRASKLVDKPKKS